MANLLSNQFLIMAMPLVIKCRTNKNTLFSQMSKFMKVKCPQKMKVPIKVLFGDKTRKRLTVTVAFVVALVLFFRSDYSPDLYFISFWPVDNITCYHSHKGDDLLQTDGIWFTPSPRSIYFHETSCRGDLTVRQLCAVESAARRHPFWEIYVLFSGPVNKSTLLYGNVAVLESLHNTNFARVNLFNYAKGTPVESLVFGGALNRTRWKYSHTSDVLRYLTLYKWGGIYLDLDVVVVKPLTSLARNWAARESDVTVASGAISFRKDRIGRLFASSALWDLKDNYRGDKWGQNGPQTMTRVLKKICDTRKITEMSSATCQGFEIYSPRFFYPVKWEESSKYFKKGEIFAPHAYIHHISNSETQNLKVEYGSPYQKLAKKYCPTTYKAFSYEFGF